MSQFRSPGDLEADLDYTGYAASNCVAMLDGSNPGGGAGQHHIPHLQREVLRDEADQRGQVEDHVSAQHDSYNI